MFEREDGSLLPITRVTQYIPGGKWKVCIAYYQADGYPIASSGPIAHHIEGKQATKKPLVHKLKEEASILKEINSDQIKDYVTFTIQPPTANGKLKINQAAFVKAMDIELTKIKDHMSKPIWDIG